MASNMIFTKKGKLQFLRWLKSLTDDKFFIGLFKNNPTPLTEDALLIPGSGNITDADFPGYAVKVNIAWGAEFLNTEDEGEADTPTLIWTRTTTGAAQTVYGVYVSVNPFLDQLDPWFVQKFPTPQVVTDAGDTVQCRLNFLDYQHNKII